MTRWPPNKRRALEGPSACAFFQIKRALSHSLSHIQPSCGASLRTSVGSTSAPAVRRPLAPARAHTHARPRPGPPRPPRPRAPGRAGGEPRARARAPRLTRAAALADFGAAGGETGDRRVCAVWTLELLKTRILLRLRQWTVMPAPRTGARDIHLAP